MGALFTILFGIAVAAIGFRIARRILPGLDNCEQIGLGGALGLATIGLTTLAIGFRFTGFLACAIAVVALILQFRNTSEAKSKLSMNWTILILLPFVALVLIAVLAPSDTRDWDSLAYHLAVPKLWIQQGQVGFVQGIHHSNFPFTADMLYGWGLQWGGETGAKAFNLCWYLLGCCTLFGIARRWYPEVAGKMPAAQWWAVLVFASCPVVLWEAGTAYVDIPHGLFCGLAMLYLADALTSQDKKFWILCGLCLGFAMGTKHTGLQTLAAIVVVAGIAALLAAKARVYTRPPVKGLATAVAIALAIASPWYIKSIVHTGNPVYPFFYRQLGGKYWNLWRSEIYAGEQKTFGVGSSPTKLGHAVLGLAYQPGRYVNPGQDQGLGFPTGSIGFAALLAGLIWCTSGKAERREKIVLATVGVSLLAWFVLSQQSRYLTSIVVPLAVLGAGAVPRLKLGKFVAIGVLLQAIYSLWMIWTVQTSQQLGVVTGQVSRENYQAATVAFYKPAQAINLLTGTVKIALYDEVFGYFLDKPYMWANPGHSTLIPYETTESGEKFAVEMKRLGFTHAYVNLQMIDRDFKSRWITAMSDSPFSPEERTQMRSDPNLWWRVLFADAVRDGKIKIVKTFPEGAEPRSVLFEFTR